VLQRKAASRQVAGVCEARPEGRAISHWHLAKQIQNQPLALSHWQLAKGPVFGTWYLAKETQKSENHKNLKI
jgi:hypothetical protein